MSLNPIDRAEAAFAAQQAKLVEVADRTTRRNELLDRLSGLRTVAGRWRDYLEAERAGVRSIETLDGLSSDFIAALNELGSRLRDDGYQARWGDADHDQNFTSYLGAEYGEPWREELNRPLSRSRYDEAVRIISEMLAGPIVLAEIRPAMERASLRGTMTYLEILLSGLTENQRFELKQPMPQSTSPNATANPKTYDPCDREPRTFAELKAWMVYRIDFDNPRRTGLRTPTIAHSADHHYLECYSKDEFREWGLNGLGKLRDRYLRQTGKTVDQIDATTLREIAGHFRHLNGIPINGIGNDATGLPYDSPPLMQPHCNPEEPPIHPDESKPDGPFEEKNGVFGIRWNSERVTCDTSERQAWEILRAMWPAIDSKEQPVADVKRTISSNATNQKFGTNSASKVRLILERIQAGFSFVCTTTDAGIEVFRWTKVSA